jgi:peptidoglycan hydrolase-like protein with peptidoglycan-binding domain
MRLDNPGKGQQRRSPFGMRKHPISGRWRMHNGIDYANNGKSFKVKAAQDGIVVKKGSNMSTTNGFGHSLTIDHGSGIRTLYAHGAQASRFKVGDRVKRGDLVFDAGTTGASTGIHLHFEVHLNGKPVDPEPYYTSNGVDPVVPLFTTGRLDRETWRRWQSVLKKSWKYEGIVDGIPGKMTWSAVQRSVVEYGYGGKIDGIPGPLTRRAVQQRLHDKGFYNGKIDGIWGKVTITALQVALGENKY